MLNNLRIRFDSWRTVIFYLLLATAVHPGSVEAEAGSPLDVRPVQAALDEAVAKGKLNGASLLVLHRDREVFRGAAGRLSLEQEVQIASSSKPIATAAVMTLVDDGKLSLGDPVSKFLPEFRGTKVEAATLEQLLSHSAGFPREYPGGRPKTGTLADFSRYVAKRGRLSAPGAFAYSGVSIDIACRMAEAASGVPFEELIVQRIWQPLGMSSTRFTLAADPRSAPASAAANGEGRYVSCGGGMSSTLDDVAAFFGMLLHDGLFGSLRILSADAVHEMRRKHAINPRKQDDPYTTGEYGLGLYRDRVDDAGNALTVSHGGALGTMPWTDLDRDLVGVFFSQARLSRVMPVIAETQALVRDAIPPDSRVDELRIGSVDTSTGREGIGDATRRSAAERNDRGISSDRGRRDPKQDFMAISGGQGQVDFDRFKAFIRERPIGEHLGNNPKAVKRLFDRIDANADGNLTADEYGEFQSNRAIGTRP